MRGRCRGATRGAGAEDARAKGGPAFFSSGSSEMCRSDPPVASDVAAVLDKLNEDVQAAEPLAEQSVAKLRFFERQLEELTVAMARLADAAAQDGCAPSLLSLEDDLLLMIIQKAHEDRDVDNDCQGWVCCTSRALHGLSKPMNETMRRLVADDRITQPCRWEHKVQDVLVLDHAYDREDGRSGYCARCERNFVILKDDVSAGDILSDEALSERGYVTIDQCGFMDDDCQSVCEPCADDFRMENCVPEKHWYRLNDGSLDKRCECIACEDAMLFHDELPWLGRG